MDRENVFESKRLEVELVRCIIVCGNCLRVAVYDDRLKAELFECESSMNAAVVEFDTLTYSVRAAAEDHYLRSVAYRALVFIEVICRIVVCSVFCTAYVNALPCFLYAEADACVS